MNDVPASGHDGDSLFATWIASGHRTPAFVDHDVLHVEHQLIYAVLDAIEAECVRLKAREPLRIDFWADVIDFVGNFVQGYHRIKEERVLFGLLADGERMTAVQRDDLHQEHGDAHTLTTDLLAAAEGGDWEAVLMIGVRFVHFLREHLAAEDALVEALPRIELDDRARRLLGEIEQRLQQHASRSHYVEVARRLCSTAGVRAP